MDKVFMITTKVFLSLCLLLSISFAEASDTTGKISSVVFYGSGPSEVVMVGMEPKVSDCPYSGKFVMYTKDRPAMTAALLSAFHAQNNVRIIGTGKCGASWSNYEVINYAVLTK